MGILSVPKKEIDLAFSYLSGVSVTVNRGVFRTESKIKMKLLAKIQSSKLPAVNSFHSILDVWLGSECTCGQSHCINT